VARPALLKTTHFLRRDQRRYFLTVWRFGAADGKSALSLEFNSRVLDPENEAGG
jgi:hypothetical protein